jgi:hypothetical protein
MTQKNDTREARVRRMIAAPYKVTNHDFVRLENHLMADYHRD